MKPETTIPKPDCKTLEEIAEEIESLSQAFQKLNSSRLKRRAITVLIRDSMTSPTLGLKDIEAVLDCAADLSKCYLKP